MFARLTVIVAAGLLGPLLAAGERPLVPMVIGELAAGALLGRTGFDLLDVDAQPFPFMFSMGFAMLMLTAGTHVDVTSTAFRQELRRALTAQLVVILGAIPAGLVLDVVFGVDQPALLIVLLAGSSAAVVFPIIEEHRLRGAEVLLLSSWIAIADLTTVLIMPLTLVGVRGAPEALLGDGAIVAVSVLVLVIGERVRQRRLVRTLRNRSRKRGWALQVRLALLLLLALAAIAERTGANSLVAGFAAGMVLARLREPGRLAKQISGLANGFFVPAFLVLLGATLDLRGLATNGRSFGLALTMAAAVLLIHLGAALVAARGERLALGLSASAQLGLPVAAASLGLQMHVFDPTVAAAIVGAGCLTMIPAAVGGRMLARRLSGSPVAAAASTEPAP